MLGFSIPIKVLRKRAQARKEIEALDKAIAEAEQEYSEPFIKTLSGVERFESALVLIDSTFLKRIHSLTDQNGKEELVEAYLNKLNEEYQMAKKDLQQTTASRAELIALGLAVKEIALSLDREITDFRQQSSEALGQFQGVATKHQHEAQQLTTELTQLKSRISKENGEHRNRLQAELESTKAEQTTRFTNLTASVMEDLQHLSAGIEQQMQLQVAENKDHRSRLQAEVEAAKAEQTTRFTKLTASVREDFHHLSAGIEQQMIEAGEKQQQLLSELSSRHEQAMSHFDEVATKHQLEMQRQAAENEDYRSRMQAQLESAKAAQTTRFTNFTTSIREDFHHLSAGVEQQMVEAGKKQQQLLRELSSRHEQAMSHFDEVATKHQLEMQRQAAELTQHAAHLREENEDHRSRMQAELESAKAEQTTRFTNFTASVREDFHHFSAGIEQQLVEAGEKHELLLAELSSRQKQETEQLYKTLKAMRLWTVMGFGLFVVAFLYLVLK